ncbi:OmpW/AlkL family protein [Candidatus Vallotia cooleyia]|uniref:OmpW/AlkL family protein n=1 Tax=Candidatus Vallotiella adelgis TaxID=1177211 RepID=UPI001D007D73|nr:OmpW family outer membrane protein [Candidatus Vallotia cooleyia]UDG82267.1 hypothetical protein GJV44_00524 [Candidatus Vallotia cooleyia]
MLIIRIIKTILLFLAIACSLNQPAAQAASGVYIATGYLHCTPQNSRYTVKITNVGNSPVNIVVSGLSASISSSDTLGFSTGYFISDNLAVQANAGIPSKFDLRGGGTLASYGKIGDMRQWNPSLVFNYYFRNVNTIFCPFVGIGVSYIWFTNMRITNPTFLSKQLHSQTSVTIHNTWAPVFNAGLGYNFSRHIFASFSVSFLLLSTNATLHTIVQTPVGTRKVTSQSYIKPNPLITFLNVGYRF